MASKQLYYGAPERLLKLHMSSQTRFITCEMEKEDPDKLLLARSYCELLWCLKQTLSISHDYLSHKDMTCGCKDIILHSDLRSIIHQGQIVNDLIGIQIDEDRNDCWMISNSKKFFLICQFLDSTSTEFQDMEDNMDFLEYQLESEMKHSDIARRYYSILKDLESYLQMNCPTLDHYTGCQCKSFLLLSSVLARYVTVEENIDEIIKQEVETDPTSCWLTQTIDKYRLICLIHDMARWM